VIATVRRRALMSSAALMLAMGFTVASLLTLSFGSTGDPDVLVALLVLESIGIGAMLVACVVSVVVNLRGDRALRDRVRDASPAVAVDGSLRPTTARVVRRRAAARHPGFVAGSAVAVTPTAVMVLLRVLVDGPSGPRVEERAALAPPEVGLPLRAGAELVVLAGVDPVAVVEPRLALTSPDPRWATAGRAPGEWLPSVAWVVGGLVVGALLGVVAGMLAV